MQVVVSKFVLATVLLCSAVALTPAQVPVVKPPKAEPPASPKRTGHPRFPAEPPEQPIDRRGTNERAIAVDPDVNVQIPCISQAHVRINGWKRDEVRVFVRDGSNIGFKVHEKDPKSDKPVWVVVRSVPGTAPTPDCISGERIDIEVPFGASLKLSGREIDTRIDSVKKVEIQSIGGNVSLRNVSGGISAETFEGDVTVENSSGQIALKTSTGNIVAFGVTPGQVGDLFKASTSNGLITLQNVDHRQIYANSVTGDLLFDGKFLPGGIYTFKTSDGAIRLVLPNAPSFRMVAWYGFGMLDQEFPMKTITSDVTPGGKRLIASVGEGDATVNLTTTRGKISITKQAAEKP
ncbi:MAG: hypothetical protein IT174_15500 [Acidobacteria bacterium]|nr:hypothetical protein [Acidobacteriota bacterium]